MKISNFFKVAAVIVMLLSVSPAFAQQFWFRDPIFPINESVTAVRPGKTGVGIPTAQWNNFNNAIGNYTFTADIQFLVQEDNFGHLERGQFGGQAPGDIWAAYGGPFEGFFPNFYGHKFQWGPYAINYQLQARGNSNFDNQIKDGQIAWNSGNGAAPGRGRLDIGNLDAMNMFNPRMTFLDNGNVGINNTNPTNTLEVNGNVEINGRLEIGSAEFIEDGGANTFRVNSSIIPDLTNVRTLGIDAFRWSTVFANTVDVTGTITATTANLSGNLNAVDANLSGNLITPAIDLNGRISIGSVEFLEDGGNNTITVGNASLVSSSNGSWNLGSSTNRWNTVFATNGTINTSDARDKEKIKNLTYGLEHIKQLKAVSFEWKGEMKNGTHCGLIAQEVKEVIPEVVYDPAEKTILGEDGKAIPSDPEARMGIAYAELIPVLINSIQELSDKVDEQTREIERLRGNNREGEGNWQMEGEAGSLGLQLYQNAPNPFNRTTSIRFNLPENIANAELYIYDMNGKQVRKIRIEERGESRVDIEAGGLEAGIYLYSLLADGEATEPLRMILTK